MNCGSRVNCNYHLAKEYYITIFVATMPSAMLCCCVRVAVPVNPGSIPAPGSLSVGSAASQALQTRASVGGGVSPITFISVRRHFLVSVLIFVCTVVIIIALLKILHVCFT